MNRPSDPIVEVVAAVTRHDPESIADHQRLADLGLDSLDRVLLAVLIEERLGRTLPDDAMLGIRTVADLRHHLARQESWT